MIPDIIGKGKRREPESTRRKRHEKGWMILTRKKGDKNKEQGTGYNAKRVRDKISGDICQKGFCKSHREEVVGKQFVCQTKGIKKDVELVRDCRGMKM